MENNIYKLTLDRKTAYRIKVPGQVRRSFLGESEIQIEYVQSGPNEEGISIMTCAFDQAGLYNFLHRLYSKGIPLIEVVCLDYTGENCI